MSEHEDNGESQDLIDSSGWDSDPDCQMHMQEPNRNRLLRFFEQYGMEFETIADITKESYSVVKRLDVLDAAENWAFTNVDNIYKLRPRIFVYATLQSYEYLTSINLSFLFEFENASIYTDLHKCNDEEVRPFVGDFLGTQMLEALTMCKCLEHISMCSCLVPRCQDRDLAKIFKANRNLLHIRLMGLQVTGPSLLSIRKPGEMSSLFLIDCWINRMYLLRALRQMKKLNVLSLRGSMISEDEYSPAKMHIAKIMKRMRLDWFECLSNFLPLYLFEKQKMVNLSVLSVDYASDSIDDHALKYISDNCKALRVFSMKRCDNVSAEGFVPIFRLPRLKYIDVSYTNVTDQALSKNISRELRVLICHMCQFTSNGLKIMLLQLDKFKIIDAMECSGVNNEFIGYLMTYSNDSLDHLVTARLSMTGINMDHVHLSMPISNLKLITEANETLDVDYRDYL